MNIIIIAAGEARFDADGCAAVSGRDWCDARGARALIVAVGRKQLHFATMGHIICEGNPGCALEKSCLEAGNINSVEFAPPLGEP